MNFEEKTIKLPIGKMKVNEFDSIIKIQDGSMFGLLFFVLIFGVTGFIFYDNKEHLHKVDIPPIFLIISGLGVLFTMKEIFLSSNFSTQISFNQIAFISFEEHLAGHFIPMTMLVLKLYSNKKRSIWIKDKQKEELTVYFQSKFIKVK